MNMIFSRAPTNLKLKFLSETQKKQQLEAAGKKRLKIGFKHFLMRPTFRPLVWDELRKNMYFSNDFV